jgi:hypothetical protein
MKTTWPACTACLKARVEVHAADLAAAQSWSGLCAHYGYPDAVLAEMKSMIERDFHYVPRPDATGYSHGQHWDLGGGVRIRAHHLPGHTSGHCALIVESEGLAFIGDIDLTGFGPYYGDATSSLAAFRKSLAEVAALDAGIWVTSHHRAVITDRAKFLADLAGFAARIDERSDKLVGYLREGPQSPDKGVECLRPQGQAEVVALHFVAAVLRRKASCSSVSTPSAMVRRPRLSGQADDGTDDGLGFPDRSKGRDEGLVDLQLVDLEALEVAQRGIAGAEVVDRHAHAARVQLVHHRDRGQRVVHGHALGQLQFEDVPAPGLLRRGSRDTSSAGGHWRNCTADRLTAMTIGAVPASIQVRICLHAVRSTHSPMGRIRPLSSATG